MRPVLLLALAYLAFISLGLPDGLLGVAWPSVRASFDLPLDALGPLLVVSTAGYVASSFASGRILSRLNLGALLALSCLATAAALLGYAVAPRWAFMVAIAILAGLGAGAIDAGLNTYVATHHSPRTLNFLHASYGLGTAAGPAIMTAVLAAASPWQRGYALVGIGQLVLAACFAATFRLWPATDAGAASPPTATANRDTLRLPVAWVSMAAFFLYTGIEAAFGAWAYSLFHEARGVDMASAAFWVSAYWGGLMAGRLVFGVISAWAPLGTLIRGSVVGIAAGAALVWLSPTVEAGLFGLALAGFACGPVFPSLIASTPARVGEAHAANLVGFEISAAALGQSLLPALLGYAAEAAGLEIIAPVLLACALGLLGLQIALFGEAAVLVATSRSAA